MTVQPAPVRTSFPASSTATLIWCSPANVRPSSPATPLTTGVTTFANRRAVGPDRRRRGALFGRGGGWGVPSSLRGSDEAIQSGTLIHRQGAGQVVALQL